MSAKENMTMRITMAAAGVFIATAIGCGGGGSGKGPLTPADDSGKKSRGGQAVSKEAAAGFDRALDAFAERDKKACPGLN